LTGIAPFKGSDAAWTGVVVLAGSSEPTRRPASTPSIKLAQSVPETTNDRQWTVARIVGSQADGE